MMLPASDESLLPGFKFCLHRKAKKEHESASVASGATARKELIKKNYKIIQTGAISIKSKILVSEDEPDKKSSGVAPTGV